MTDKEKEWPKNKSGNFVADHGKLPLRVKEIDKMLADPSHHCKSWGRALYKLYFEKGQQIGMTKIDCEHLKWNFSYWHCQNVIKPFKKFQKPSVLSLSIILQSFLLQGWQGWQRTIQKHKGRVRKIITSIIQ